MSTEDIQIVTEESSVISPLSPENKSKLEKQIKGRPDPQVLVDRNILKDGSVAPALQAARDRLQKSQLQDKLDNTLQTRPSPEELVKKGILNEDEAPITL